MEPTTRIERPDRLPWHRPALQSLVVSTDTSNAIGSGPDAETHEFFIIID